MRFINLCTVDNSYEANFIKEDLEDNGIPCILTNENITTLMPHMNGILGSGVQVLVDKKPTWLFVLTAVQKISNTVLGPRTKAKRYWP